MSNDLVQILRLAQQPAHRRLREPDPEPRIDDLAEPRVVAPGNPRHAIRRRETGQPDDRAVAADETHHVPDGGEIARVREQRHVDKRPDLAALLQAVGPVQPLQLLERLAERRVLHDLRLAARDVPYVHKRVDVPDAAVEQALDRLLVGDQRQRRRKLDARCADEMELRRQAQQVLHRIAVAGDQHDILAGAMLDPVRHRRVRDRRHLAGAETAPGAFPAATPAQHDARRGAPGFGRLRHPREREGNGSCREVVPAEHDHREALDQRHLPRVDPAVAPCQVRRVRIELVAVFLRALAELRPVQQVQLVQEDARRLLIERKTDALEEGLDRLERQAADEV